MKARIVLVIALTVCFVMAAATSAHAGFFLDGRNIYAVPKPLGNWNIHLTNDDDPSLQGNLQLVWTTCEKGVGMALTAPQAMPLIDHGVMTIHLDGAKDVFRIPIAQYQLGFCWVLSEWPEPWAFEEIYFDEAETMSACVEWKADLGYMGLQPSHLFDALHRNGGYVEVQYFDAYDNVVLSGEVR